MNAAARVRNAYQQSEAQAQIHPVKLIHLMYERVLTHLEYAEEGVNKKDVKLRGENLSKAIALISELNASIKDDDNSEAAEFLRGLYSAILVELPKVAISNDALILQRAYNYIKRLKEIWEDTALKEADLDSSEDTAEKHHAHAAQGPEKSQAEEIQRKSKSKMPAKNLYAPNKKLKPVSAACDENIAKSGLSFSI